MLVRIGMGSVQAFVLAVVPWLAMLVVSGLPGNTYPVSQLSLHVLFLLTGGAVFLALALLISSLVEGQYTAPIVGIGISVQLINSLKGEKLNPYSPWTFMMGSEFFQARTGLFSGHLPLLHAAAFCAVAMLLMFISIKVIKRRDF
jgi:ABC-type transport system involved in multi-copper enzyme maturation permease subunit